MSRLSTISKCIILSAGLITFALTSINCYHDVLEPEIMPVVQSSRGTAAAPEYITVGVTAIVTGVKNVKNKLGGAVSAGDTLRGSFIYDERCADSNSDPRFGAYYFDESLFGIALEVSGLTFRSDISSTDLQIHLANDDTLATERDSCELKSLNNMNVLPGVKVKKIQITLRDDEAANLSSDNLFGTDPFLHQWLSSHVVRIQGIGWSISADVVSFTSNNRTVSQKISKNKKKEIHQD